MSGFWKFKNDAGAGTDPELILYGEIADQDSWWDDNSVSPQQFRQDLQSLGNPSNINVRINSVGGDVFAAHAIYNMLKAHPAKVTACIDGLCASAATIVAMAGDTIRMPSNTMMMVHKPAACLWGSYNANDMDKLSDTLDKVQESIVAAYVSKTGRSAKDLSKLMDDETWMTAAQAKTEGFCDEVIYTDPNGVNAAIPMGNSGRYMIVNSVAHDMSRFNMQSIKEALNMPKDTKVKNDTDPDKDPDKEAGETTPDDKKGVADTLDIKTVDDLRKAFPALVDQIVEAAVKDAVVTAVTEERSRLQAIDNIAHNLDKTLVTNAKYGEKPTSAQDLAYQAMQGDVSLGNKYVDTRANELLAANTGKVDGHTDMQPEDTAVIDKIAASANKRLNKGGKN